MTTQLQPKEAVRERVRDITIEAPPAKFPKVRPPWYKRASYLIPSAIILMIMVVVAVVALVTGGQQVSPPSGEVGMQFVDAGTGPTQVNRLLSSTGTVTVSGVQVGGASTGPTVVDELLSSV